MVCRSGCYTSETAKTAEPIEVPLGLWARLRPRYHVTNGSQEYMCVLKFLLPLMTVRLFILWLLVTLSVELTLKCTSQNRASACGIGSDRKLRSNIILRSVLRRTGESGSIESGAPLPHAAPACSFGEPSQCKQPSVQHAALSDIVHG